MEENAVRVPYVPQIVKDEITKEVAAEVRPTIKGEVAAEFSPANVRSGLPEWLQRFTWTGDVRFRGEADDYGRNNATFSYLDFNAVNASGGIVAAGGKAYIDTNADVDRARVRVRFGFDADLEHKNYFIAHETIVRRESGSSMDPISFAIFSFLNRIASRAPDFFKIPQDAIIEVGFRVEI